MTVILVGAGGAIGSVARYALSTLTQRLVPTLFPVGTFAVNVVGCIVFGVLVGLAQARFLMRPETRAFLLIGVLGGFTTFSSFAFETFELLRDGQFVWAAMNIVGQVAAGMVGMWAGYVAAS